MADPAHPDVPNAPGVPVLASYHPDGTDGGDSLVTQDAREVSAIESRQWGIFTRSGDLALEPDNIGGVEYQADWRVADYPMEAGEFGSYNKVATPYAVRVMMSKGGTLAERQNFERALQGIVADLILYNVVTPERTYVGVNIEHISLSRSADRGAGMLTYEVGFREIRDSGGIEFDGDDTGDSVSTTDTVPTDNPNSTPEPTKPVVKTPKNPSAARKVSRGAVQPRNPTADADARLIANGFKKLPNGDLYINLGGK